MRGQIGGPDGVWWRPFPARVGASCPHPPSVSTLSAGTRRARPQGPPLALGEPLCLGQVLGSSPSRPAAASPHTHPAGMEDVPPPGGLTSAREVTGDGTDPLPWGCDTRGSGAGRSGEERQRRARGRMHGGRRRRLLKTKGARVAVTCAVNPRAGLLHAAPSITRRRDRHQSHYRSFHPLCRVGTQQGPILPQLQICRGTDCRALGWDGSRQPIGPWQALISWSGRRFPTAAAWGRRLCRSGAAPIACPAEPHRPVCLGS